MHLRNCLTMSSMLSLASFARCLSKNNKNCFLDSYQSCKSYICSEPSCTICKHLSHVIPQLPLYLCLTILYIVYIINYKVYAIGLTPSCKNISSFIRHSKSLFDNKASSMSTKLVFLGEDMVDSMTVISLGVQTQSVGVIQK